MVVVFSVAKSSVCFVEYNSHDSLQARVIEGIGHLRNIGQFLSANQMQEKATCDRDLASAL